MSPRHCDKPRTLLMSVMITKSRSAKCLTSGEFYLDCNCWKFKPSREHSVGMHSISFIDNSFNLLRDFIWELEHLAAGQAGHLLVAVLVTQTEPSPEYRRSCQARASHRTYNKLNFTKSTDCESISQQTQPLTHDSLTMSENRQKCDVRWTRY